MILIGLFAIQQNSLKSFAICQLIIANEGFLLNYYMTNGFQGGEYDG